MRVEDFFNRANVIDLSFFNFRNAITACYFATSDLTILKVNENFRRFFPVLGNVSNAHFPDVLEQLGVPGEQIEQFAHDLDAKGAVLIPKIELTIDGQERCFSLLSTRTTDDSFSYLNGVQGQFVDRTEEWALRREREALLEQKIRDREIIEEKSLQLERLATRLARYLSPQIYQSIFADTAETPRTTTRKNLTIFFSDIEQFTDLSDTLEPERLATVINSYLSEMSSIAIECGGTIDKFIGDAILVFFGDPTTEGEEEDALRCVEMALRMHERVEEMQAYWMKHGVPRGLHVRMGLTTGYCTVGNFGSDKRLDYTVLGSPVNLASRLQAMAPADAILVSETTHSVIRGQVDCEPFGEVTPKGFVRPVEVFRVIGFRSPEHREHQRRFSRVGEHIEVNLINSSNIRAAITELRRIHDEFEAQFGAE